MTPFLVCLIEPSELVLFTDFAFQANNGFKGESMLSFFECQRHHLNTYITQKWTVRLGKASCQTS